MASLALRDRWEPKENPCHMVPFWMPFFSCTSFPNIANAETWLAG